MIRMTYNTNSCNSNDTYVKNIENENITLSELFAEFIDFARVIGYQHGSWKHIINDVQDYFDEGLNIYDYSLDHTCL